MRSKLASPLLLLLAPSAALASAPFKGNPIPLPIELSEIPALRDFGRTAERSSSSSSRARGSRG